MADENRCPKCGALHAEGARQGLCLRCLMLNVLEEQPLRSADETETAGGGELAAGQSLEPTEPDSGMIDEPPAAPGRSTSQDPARAARDSATGAADVTRTADGNEPRRDPSRGEMVRYFGDYEIKKELGRGGMGVVYLARQVSLNRPVALKMIRAGVLADMAELRRFQNEAEALALLDHPGIVPVHEVGDHDGQKYFSMKLVEGGSLAEQVAAFTDNPRAAATLLAEAAGAVHHAHMRGILHRDLKPANILVDTEGHPHVTDFGLAKRVEEDPELTASGMILGTPAYMSPEQATGHRGTITTATDVYGLGAILYALLVGKAPFGGESPIQTIEAVRNRAPEPPSRFNAKVPRDLETICLKCLEKDPRRRYAGAQALEDDLRSWLSSRPISARRVGVGERAWLWCKRRPAVAALIAAVIVASVGGTAAVIAVQAKANAELKAANQREKQRFALAMDAIKLFHGEVSEDVMMKEKAFEGLRKKLLSGAAVFYGRLEALLEGQTDRESREALGKAYFELAELTGKIGDQTAALAVHRKGLEVHRALASAPMVDIARKLDVARSLNAAGWLQGSTGDRALAIESLGQARSLAEEVGTVGRLAQEARVVLGTALSFTGNLLDETGDTAGARANYEKALAIRRLLVDGNPGDENFQRDLAAAHNSIGRLDAKTGDPSGAISAYRKALPIQRKLADAHRGVTDYQLDLAWTQMSIGIVLSETGDSVGARTAYDEALIIRQRLAKENPTVTAFQDQLANGYNNLGSLLSGTGDAPGARGAFAKAIEIRQKLADLNPDVVQFRKELAKSWNYQGNLLAATGDVTGARACLKQSVAIAKKLADANPDVVEFHRELALSHTNVGALLAQTGDPDGARGSFGQALEIQRKLATDHPGMAEIQRDVAMSHNNIGAMLARTDDLAGARESCGRALAIQQKLAEANPSVTGFQLELARSHYNIGIVLSQAGDASGALESNRQALAIQQKLADASPSVSEFQQSLANTHESIGNLMSAVGAMVEAGEAYAKAMAIRQKLADANPTVTELQADLAGSLTGLGWLRLKSGQPEAAIDYFSREEAIWKKLVDDNPGVPSFRNSLANCETNCATVLLRLGRPAAARPRCEDAVAMREALVKADPKIPQYRKNLGESLLRLGQARQATGDLVGAAADWTRADGLFKTVSVLDGEYTFYWGGCQASLSTLAGLPGTGVGRGEKDARSRQAMALLRKAAGMGYRSPLVFLTETALEPLRGRDDFRLMLLDLAFPLDPFAR